MTKFHNHFLGAPLPLYSLLLGQSWWEQASIHAAPLTMSP